MAPGNSESQWTLGMRRMLWLWPGATGRERKVSTRIARPRLRPISDRCTPPTTCPYTPALVLVVDPAAKPSIASEHHPRAGQAHPRQARHLAAGRPWYGPYYLHYLQTRSRISSLTADLPVNGGAYGQAVPGLTAGGAPAVQRFQLDPQIGSRGRTQMERIAEPVFPIVVPRAGPDRWSSLSELLTLPPGVLGCGAGAVAVVRWSCALPRAAW